MDKNKYKNHIGETDYVRRPLVIGQVKQLMDVLGDIILPADIDIPGIIAVLGVRLPYALAVILTEKDTHPKDKDIDGLGESFTYTLETSTAIQAVEDFFVLNPVASLLEKMSGMVDKIHEALGMNGSKSFAASSQQET